MKIDTNNYLKSKFKDIEFKEFNNTFGSVLSFDKTVE